jgi:hypothetical protein
VLGPIGLPWTLRKILTYGDRALSGNRQSIPSLLMVSRDLGAVLRDRYGSERAVIEYVNRLKHLRDTAA